MINVLFVCLGNICRSPMAEALFRNEVAQSGLLEEINIDSAGTASWHTGKMPHEGTRAILDDHDVSYENMSARQINQSDWHKFDYIITMDDQNMIDIKKEYNINTNVVFKKLMDYIENPQEENVPDPYYTGDFNYTYELVLEGVKSLLIEIKKDKL